MSPITTSSTMPTTSAQGSAPHPGGLSQRAGKEAMRFLVRVCNRRGCVKPYLMADLDDGYFTTSREFEGVWK